jgi:hypothetical protein
LAQLFQLFGEIRLADADSLLRKFVPKEMTFVDSRTAACWALGKIHEGNTVPELATQFTERLSDISSMMPEAESVRCMCAVGIGRMKAQSELSALRQFGGEAGLAGLACRWSIHYLTGEEQPELKPGILPVLGWFLQPVGD